MKPDLLGKRVLLRTIASKDAESLFEIYGNEKAMEFASDPVFVARHMVLQLLESVNRLEESGESLEWAVVERVSGKVIGTCGLHSFSDCGQTCEVGCLLNPDYWRQGFMSEALVAMLWYAKNRGIKKVIADVDRENVRSKAFFESFGFKLKSEQFFYEL